MGLSLSPYIFDRVSDFTVRCAIKEWLELVVSYMDDCCVIGGSREEAMAPEIVVLNIIWSLGFHSSYEKGSQGGMKACLSGINIDLESLELSLPNR